MTTPANVSGTYTLEDSQQDIANLTGQLAQIQDVIQTVSDKSLVMYAPDQHANARGPVAYSWEDGTVDGWSGLNGTVTNSTVTVTGWPTAGTHSLLLTPGGSAAPQAFGPGGTSGIPSQPNDNVQFQCDIYCPLATTNVYLQISWYDDTGTFISGTGTTAVNFTAGQIQTLYCAGTAPDLTQYFTVAFGSTSVLTNTHLIYGDNITIQGNLHLSISPGGGTDTVGNPYPGGFCVQWPGQVAVQGPRGQSIIMEINGANGQAELQFNTGASYQGVPGQVSMGQSSVSGIPYMYLILACPDVTGTSETVYILLNSAPSTGHTFAAGGDLVYQDTSAVGHAMLTWGSGGVKVSASPANHAGDTGSYQTERITLTTGSPITINTTPYSQGLMSTAGVLGLGTYHVEGLIGVNPGSTGATTTYAFSLGSGSGLVVSSMRVFWEEILVQNAANFGNTGWQTGLAPGGFTTSGVAPSGTDRCIKFSGTIVVSTAGGLTVYAGTNSVANTFQVFGNGTWMRVSPIN